MFPCNMCQRHRGGRTVIPQHILNHGANVKGCSTTRPDRVTPRKEHRYHSAEYVWVPGQVWLNTQMRNQLAPVGFKLRTVQPIASCYTKLRSPGPIVPLSRYMNNLLRGRTETAWDLYIVLYCGRVPATNAPGCTAAEGLLYKHWSLVVPTCTARCHQHRS